MAVKVKTRLKKPEELTIVIVGGDTSVRTLFAKRGYKVATIAALASPSSYDGVVFTGGGDISPYLYGQGLHPSTSPDYSRDLRELSVLRRIPIKKPKIGICRGAQLLNVVNGGTLIQDLDGHRSSHKATDLWGGGEFTVSSLHHQAIVPHPDAWVMMTASIATRHSTYDETKMLEKNDGLDCEACFYTETNSYCFQGHPEYAEESAKVFFEHLWAVYNDVWIAKVETETEQEVMVG